MASPAKRRDRDVMKLMMSGYQVTVEDEVRREYIVVFSGPKGTPYEGGTWRVLVMLPEQYPFKSPSIGFRNRIFHPNVDEASGSVCLDVINQTWSPMFDLINVFDVFLPQLLAYPNPSDPLNGDAAALLLREPERFNARVRDYVVKYANAGAASAVPVILAPTDSAAVNKSVRKISESSDSSSDSKCREEDDNDVDMADGGDVESVVSDLSDLSDA